MGPLLSTSEKFPVSGSSRHPPASSDPTYHPSHDRKVWATTGRSQSLPQNSTNCPCLPVNDPCRSRHRWLPPPLSRKGIHPRQYHCGSSHSPPSCIRLSISQVLRTSSPHIQTRFHMNGSPVGSW